MQPIDKYIDRFLREFKYIYGDDEYVLDNWVSQQYPGWYELRSGGVLYLPTDGERDARLGGAYAIDLTHVGKEEGEKLANEVLDWSMYTDTGLPIREHCDKQPAQQGAFAAKSSHLSSSKKQKRSEKNKAKPNREETKEKKSQSKEEDQRLEEDDELEEETRPKKKTKKKEQRSKYHSSNQNQNQKPVRRSKRLAAHQ